LAMEGACGKISVLGKGVVPHSDNAHMALFGYDLGKHYMGRGPLEAAGVGFKLKNGDIAFRANIATVNNQWLVKDRRAGRIKSTKAFAKKLNGMEIEGVKFLVTPGTAYRMVVVMRAAGRKLSDKITECDPRKTGEKVKIAAAKDGSAEAKFTAMVLNKFLEKSYLALNNMAINRERKKKGLLPGNFPLVRGAGQYKKIPLFNKKHGVKSCCIAGAGLYKGIGTALGMDVLKVKGATGLPNTNVKAKFLAAKKAMEEYNFVFVHIKPTDSLGEDGNALGKKEFIEKIDRAIKVLHGIKARIVITADHSTPCEEKAHSADPVPLLMHGKSIEADEVKAFNEKECEKGRIGLIEGKDLMEKVLAEKV